MIENLATVRSVLGFPPELAAGGPPPHADLSVRKLDVWGACDMQYDLRYNQRADKGPLGGSSEAMRTGSLAHRVLFAAGKSRVGVVGWDGPVERKELRRFLEAQNGKSNLAELDRAWDLLRPMAPMDFSRTVALEEPVRLDFGTGILWGQADRVDMPIDGVLVIYDYKSGRNVKDDEDLESDTQVRTYLSALHQMSGLTDITFRTFYIAYNRPVDVKWTADRHESTLAWLRARRREITEEREWKASPGRACTDCPWQTTCAPRAEALKKECDDGELKLTTSDDEVVLRERNRLKGGEDLYKTKRTRIDGYLREVMAGGREVSGGGLVARLKSRVGDKPELPGFELVTTHLAEAAGMTEHEDPWAVALSVGKLDYKRFEAWAATLGDKEVKVRDALRELEIETQGPSWVEVAKL